MPKNKKFGFASSHIWHTDLIDNYLWNLNLAQNAIVSITHGWDDREKFWEILRDKFNTQEKVADILVPKLRDEPIKITF